MLFSYKEIASHSSSLISLDADFQSYVSWIFFKDIFKNITLANDLEFKYATNSPTMLVEGMIVGGK